MTTNNLITYNGKIVFEPVHATKKHLAQAEKKRVAMVMFGGDISEYYAWFLKKQYDVVLNKPLRGGHVTFVNDWFYSIDEPAPNPVKEVKWNQVKEKYHNKRINLTFTLDYHTNGNHWWIIVNHDYREELLNIRSEIGLGKPTFGFHMTLGTVNEQQKIQSDYIKSLGDNGYIELKKNFVISK